MLPKEPYQAVVGAGLLIAKLRHTKNISLSVQTGNDTNFLEMTQG